MSKSAWGNMLNQKAVTSRPQSNYQLRHLEHVGNNPMYTERVQKAFKVHPSKVKLNAPGTPGVGSPWEAMRKK